MPVELLFSYFFFFVQSQDVYSISVLPDEDNTSQQCASQLAFLSLLEVPFPSKSNICLDAQLNCHNCFDLQMEGADAFPPCIVNINMEKENSEAIKSTDEAVGSIKTEGVVTVSSIFHSHYMTFFSLVSYISYHMHNILLKLLLICLNCWLSLFYNACGFICPKYR